VAPQQINGLVHDKGQRWFKGGTYCGCRLLVAMTPFPELFDCAKDLFVAAMMNRLPQMGYSAARDCWRKEAPAGLIASGHLSDSAKDLSVEAKTDPSGAALLFC
jgi:hypothetical protein